jgi:geranylgeranyl reductase family protein
VSARDVLVVGGGPAGTATAIFLKQRGHDVLLVDEARFPRDKVCGEGVSPEAWRLLDAMNASERVRALRPWPLRGMVLSAPDGTQFRGLYRSASGALGFAAPREKLDSALLAAARGAGVEVREATRVTELILDSGRVAGATAVTGSGPESLRARLVIGADGRRSVVARRLGLLREHRSLRKFAVRGYWEDMEGLEEMGEMHVGIGCYCGIAPHSASSANVTFVLDRAALAATGGDLEAFYRAALKRWPRVSERLARARLVGPPRAIGPLAIEARRLSVPGALLVGDSAGFYDPFTGEGVALALRSAELAAPVADAALRSGEMRRLAAYDRLRHAATRDKFRLNRLLQRAVAWPWLGNAVAHRLARRSDLADRLVGIAGDFVPARSALDVSFVWSLLTA